MQPCPRPGIVTELGKRNREASTLAAGDVRQVVPKAADPRVRYVRVRVELAGQSTCDWILTVRDAEYRVVQTLTPADFTTVSTRWTARILTPQAIFDLERCEGAQQPVFRFDEYIAMPDRASAPFYSSQSDKPQWQSLYEANREVRHLGDSTGLFMSAWGEDSWVCSGVMLTRDLFLTNWHCGGPDALPANQKWNPLVVRESLIDLSWDTDQISREYVVGEVVEQDEALDFALLRVSPIHGGGPARPIRVKAAPVQASDPIQLVHHPLGERKKISLKPCTVIDADRAGWRGTPKTEFTHKCDTEGGSSGGPVIDADGDLVGLHHLGFEFAADCRTSDKLNKAVHISHILKHLEDKRNSVWLEIKPQIRSAM